jgi:hypothetical protein
LASRLPNQSAFPDSVGPVYQYGLGFCDGGSDVGQFAIAAPEYQLRRPRQKPNGSAPYRLWPLTLLEQLHHGPIRGHQQIVVANGEVPPDITRDMHDGLSVRLTSRLPVLR